MARNTFDWDDDDLDADEQRNDVPDLRKAYNALKRQNKELSDLLWRRGEAERLLIQAETTFAQVSRANQRHASASLTPPAQESAAAAALSAGAEGPEHVKEAESRLKKLDKELHEERQ